MRELIDRFIDRLSKIEGRSQHTIRAYRSTLLEFYEWLKQNNYSLDDVDEEVIEEYLMYLADRGLKPRSIKRHLDALRKFFKYIKKDIDWDYLRIRPKESYEFKVLSEDDIKRIIEYAYIKNPVHGLMLQLAYEVGLRASELAELNVGDFNIEECTINVRPKKREQVVEAIPISLDLCNKLRDYVLSDIRDPDEPLFKTKFGNRWKPHLISGMFREYAMKLGYYNVRYHDFARHSRATNLLKKGVDVFVVSKILRHRSLNTTTKYLHLVPVDIREKLKQVEKERY